MNEIKYWSMAAARGQISRREFMGRASALGISAGMAGTLLSSAVQAAGPQKGGTIRAGIQGGSATDSLDPATSANSVTTMVSRFWGEPLVELAHDDGVEGKVAESFEGSADASTWTFKIRDGISFSNGKAVTAQDVVDTLDRHSGEETKSGALGLMRGIKDVRADGGNVVIDLKQPNADLPYLMADYHLMIQPDGGFDNPAAAIGTGAYVA